MKTQLKKTILAAAIAIFAAAPVALNAQADLTIGLNYSYNPPSNCNNQLTSIEVDICNNGSGSASSFLVGIYLYNSSTQEHWVLDQTTVNSLSGNACVTINNWNIDMNQYPSLPAPGTNYKIGVWADTANVISESNENNNASLLSGNIQVCATTTAIKKEQSSISVFDVYPNPMSGSGQFSFRLVREEKIEIAIYDLTGKMVQNEFSGTLSPGSHLLHFDSSKLKEGFYFAGITTESGSITKKIAVIK